MTVAQKLNWNESPESVVLRDCDRVVSRARRLIPRIENRDAPAEEVRRLVRDIHSVKGAVGFLNRRGVLEGLHQLETVLTASLAPDGHEDLADTSALFRDLERYLSGGIGWASNQSEPERVHRFGESLWWTHELTESTAVKLNKRAFVLVNGGQIIVCSEVHRVLQSILVHLVRNAIVHGIEAPEVRRAAGKSEIGLITISAVRDETTLSVTVSDNGAGLSESVADGLFKEGVSSADCLNEYAGRGVGLSTVRELIEEVGGQIDVSTTVGDGLTFFLTFPDPVQR